MKNKGKIYCGIDETSKMEALGPIVLCGAIVPEEDFNELYNKCGVRDSKVIGHKINKLGKYLKNKYENIVYKISAEEISFSKNINALETKYILRIIEKFYNKVDKIYIDSVSPNPENLYKYEGKLNEFRDKLIIKCHADENYIPTMTASIIAKYVGNSENIYLNNKFGIGSGSPGDQRTLKYILENMDNKNKLIRLNWVTYTRLAENKELREKLINLINSGSFNLIKLKDLYKNV